MGSSRRLLKTNAKKSLKQNYWRFTAVCFLVAILCGSSLTTTQLLQQNRSDEVRQLIHLTSFEITATGFVNGLMDIVSAIVLNQKELIGIILFVLSVVLWALYKIYVSNIIRVGSKRFFMETRVYPKTSVKKILYLYEGKDIRNSACIMLRMYVYRFFWWFTIIGGIIKTFEYAMIPFILAENPDITSGEAFRLSKEMMHGKKWSLFTLEVSFLLWYLLGIITMGLTNIFYLNAYRSATETEFYMMIRREIVASRNRNSVLFIDKYLENKPSEDEILINMFASEKNYTPNLEAEEFSHNIYPMFLRGKDSKWYEAPYENREVRQYHVTSYIIIFFLASIAGWVLDVIFGFLQSGQIFSGNLAQGPWLPIVGFVTVVILIIGQKLEKHPLINVLFITIFASTVQYFYVWVVELIRGVRYWDFSEYLLNVNGRICLASMVVLGAIGAALYYVIAPAIDDMLLGFPIRKKKKWCVVLCALLLLDVIVSIYILFF